MKVITFSALKGGVGKSSLTIMMANILNRCGFRVLVGDLDLPNALTFYFAPSETEVENRNIYKAVSSDNLKDNIIKCSSGIDLIASSFKLIRMRTLPIRTLSELLKQVEQDYDFCLLDTAPTYDNIVLNGMAAAAQIIHLTQLSQFSWNSSRAIKEILDVELGHTSNWKILLNMVRETGRETSESELVQYLELFRESFPENLLHTRIPGTVMVQKATDTGITISKAKGKRKLYEAMKSLTSELIQEDFTFPERF
jgi:chromosome partitioning protein